MGLTKQGLERLWAHITNKFNTLIGDKPVSEQIEEAVEGISPADIGAQPAGDYALKSDVASISVPNSNLVNGSAEGSLRTVGSMAEDSIYHIGDDAFATGFETEASGACSHAEGIAAIAAGAFSHAEGRNAYAGGEASHAEGIYTYTEGDQSHAEGNTTHALGSRSHAEGYASVARGEASHAEGSSYAHNSRSHSEGTDTVAEGHHSHSEGAFTHAKGDSSHAEGYGMTVELEISGEANALTFQYVPFGYGHLYPGMTVHYYYSEMVYRHDDGDSSTYEHTYGVTRSTLATIVAVDEDAETITLDKPLSDVALEYEMVYAYMGGVAHGEASHSEGYSTIAAGLAQHAEGAYNVIDPQHDYNNSDSRAKYIHIAGNGESDLNRSNAHALDWNGNAYYAGNVYVTGDGKNDFAGAKKLATENSVEAVRSSIPTKVSALTNDAGYLTEHQSLAGYATQGYVDTKVAGLVDSAPETLNTLNELAAALGDDPNFATTVATKIGELETAVDNFEVPNSNLVNGSAEGSLRTIRSMQEDSNYTMGPHAFAEGDLTMAEGNSSHAEGYSTKAFGETCHAEGNSTSADGACSHAEGYMSSVEGFGSHAEGFATCAYGRGQHVEGEFNIPDEVDEVRDRGQYLHIAGNGSWDNQIESNAYTLDWSGNGWFAGDVYVGSTSGTNKDEGSKKLATEDFVTAALTSLGLPVPTAADAGKILRVNAQGKYELVSIANAEEATF